MHSFKKNDHNNGCMLIYLYKQAHSFIELIKIGV